MRQCEKSTMSNTSTSTHDFRSGLLTSGYLLPTRVSSLGRFCCSSMLVLLKLSHPWHARRCRPYGTRLSVLFRLIEAVSRCPEPLWLASKSPRGWPLRLEIPTWCRGCPCSTLFDASVPILAWPVCRTTSVAHSSYHSRSRIIVSL